ncbi:T9SS type A sorting domain-containing protein [Tenacibaculum maritimum]|nr:T9SS type A sorting domain-containing protein [Tenacibaculum maritimum]MDB0611406.1 T9SS type A sorting domain-containing protein [Tenacibaculum maritimum]
MSRPERLLTGNYSITNAMGQMVKKGKLSSKSHHLINMDVLPGMYFIKTIFQNGETNTISLVKK